MSIKTFQSPVVKEKYYYEKHPTGYDIFLFQKPEHSKTYAMFAAKYGSIDNEFKAENEGKYTTVPAGIAHFLEHKLFENEKENAFARYAKTGASANAYTSFDKTAYLFSCTDNFEESLEILFDFVQNPYFTHETVQKEQGIIGQEIRMYQDNPDWQVFFNLLRTLYENHTIRIDIAGTLESISNITADMLYKCYNYFYNPSNMAIVVCGPVTFDTVRKIADKCLRPKENIVLDRCYSGEPACASKDFVSQNMAVSIPLFNIGIKDTNYQKGMSLLKKIAETELLLKYIAGESSALYKTLYDNGLINPSFYTDTMYSAQYGVTLLGGESKNPERVNQLFFDEIRRIKNEGLDEKIFIRCKKALYGKQVSRFENVESIANSLLTAHFNGAEIFDILKAYGDITVDDAVKRLNEHFNEDYAALSVINPAEK